VFARADADLICLIGSISLKIVLEHELPLLAIVPAIVLVLEIVLPS
jgi:hypothetical protein